MEADQSVGRRLGVLVLAHLPIGLMAPYIIMNPVILPPGFLANAAGGAAQVRAAVFLMFAGSAIVVGASITALPVIRRHSSAAPLWLVALAVIYASLQAVDSGAILSLLSLSQHYVESGAGDPAPYQLVAVAVGAIRKWTHYTHLLFVGSWLFMLHAILLRFALVPRWLAAVGLVATVCQIVGVTLRAILGYPIITPMAMPLAVTYLTLGLWLTINGFPTER